MGVDSLKKLKLKLKFSNKITWSLLKWLNLFVITFYMLFL